MSRFGIMVFRVFDASCNVGRRVSREDQVMTSEGATCGVDPSGCIASGSQRRRANSKVSRVCLVGGASLRCASWRPTVAGVSWVMLSSMRSSLQPEWRPTRRLPESGVRSSPDSRSSSRVTAKPQGWIVHDVRLDGLATVVGEQVRRRGVSRRLGRRPGLWRAGRGGDRQGRARWRSWRGLRCCGGCRRDREPGRRLRRR